MITMNELVDLRMQHMAHELYRQQIMQRIPDPFPAMLPVPIPRHIVIPQRQTLPGVDATLQNNDLWKQFHQIGTEMIITKSGRRMFPSMRLSLSGLEDDVNYCILLEMVPIGDCRYKFSGSQWVPAGGAEPQSPQRMYLHPDSPASGSHWQAQPILFNKVKLTNNTLDNNGHIVLTSMHKYQPRIHIIRTSDPTQIPWAPQKAFIFPETEFVAVTAYQNDRITKLKIDNNPFAKGFRETGQSRCKRKMTSSPDSSSHQQQTKSAITSDSLSPPSEKSLKSSFDKSKSEENSSSSSYEIENHRMKSNSSVCSSSSLDDVPLSVGSNSSGTSSPNPSNDDMRNCCPATHPMNNNDLFLYHIHPNVQSLMNPSAFVDLACSYFKKPIPSYTSSLSPPQQHQQFYSTGHHLNDYYALTNLRESKQNFDESSTSIPIPTEIALVNSSSPSSSPIRIKLQNDLMKIPRKNSFTISAILGDDR